VLDGCAGSADEVRAGGNPTQFSSSVHRGSSAFTKVVVYAAGYANGILHLGAVSEADDSVK